MAEFCVDCWNKINETQDSKWRYILSWQRDYCEECGQYKKVIIAERYWPRIQRSLIEVIDNIKHR